MRSSFCVLAAVVFACASAALGLIPAEDFAIVQKYAEIAASSPRFIFAESIHSNTSSRVVVDVRAAADYAEGHIKGAINVPSNILLSKKGLALLPADKPLAIVCYTGRSAAIGTALLGALGYDAVAVSFGMMSWNAKTDVSIWSPSHSQVLLGGDFEVVS